MGFMGIGWQELMLILVGALVIFGPNRLPEVASQVGKFVRDLRKMTTDMTSEFEKSAGVGDIKKAVQSELQGIKNEIDGVAGDIQKGVGGATKSVNSSVASASRTVKSAANGKAGAGNKASTPVQKGPITAKTANAATAKPAGGKAAAGVSGKFGGATKAAEAPKPVVSKKDPLADFLEFAEEPVAAAKPAAAASKAPAAVGAAPSSADTLDAVNRARQRRASAGYNRNSA